MKIIEMLTVMVISLVMVVALPPAVLAVSYPILEEHRQIKEKAVMKAGSTVYLFHSNTPEVKKSIRADDVLIVYRESTNCEMKETGKIKVVSFIGENYIKGVVTEGEIRPDDIAKKDAVSVMVMLSSEKCK